MLALLADENFNGRIQMGLRPRLPDVDLVSVQELGMRQVDDPEILERAAQERRIVLTHDANTVPGFARHPQKKRQVLRQALAVRPPRPHS